MAPMDERDALSRAIGFAGGQTKLAQKIGCKQGQVNNWLRRDGRAPATRVLDIEAAIDRQISRHQLRPDVFGEAA